MLGFHHGQLVVIRNLGNYYFVVYLGLGNTHLRKVFSLVSLVFVVPCSIIHDIFASWDGLGLLLLRQLVDLLPEHPHLALSILVLPLLLFQLGLLDVQFGLQQVLLVSFGVNHFLLFVQLLKKIIACIV